MLLQNLLTHMRNKAVLVNGHIYKIAQDLVIRDEAGNPQDVPEVDAQKLLGNQAAWAPYDAKAPQKAPVKVAQSMKISLVTSTGDTIPPPESKLPEPPPAKVGAPVEAKVEKLVEVVPPPVKVEQVEDPPIPKGDEEWADPKPEFSLKWLQACAKAYRIRYKGKDKPVLVEKIKEAMYE